MAPQENREEIVIYRTADKIWKHPWVVAFCNVLLVMVLYTLSRLFFFLINRSMFPDVSGAHLWELCKGGVRFDLTAVLYLNSLYILLMLLPLRIRENHLYGKIAQWVYWVPNIIGLLVNCVDMVYFRFSDRRTTCRFFSEFQNDGNLGSILMQGIVGYWYVTLFAVVLVVLLVLLTRKEVLTHDKRRGWVYYLTETLLLVGSVYMVVIGIRGGFGKYTRPITISNALQYVDKPNETAIVLNTPFSLMKSLENTFYTNPQYFPKEELDDVFTPEHKAINGDRVGGQDKKNVVVFILESFSKEYIGFFNGDLDGGAYEGYTPFLDSLLQHSRSYPLSFASGRKSIDAMPSVLSSIPMLIEPYVVTPYSTNDISSLADCLGREGYSTAFFHGAPNGSMGFQAYARSAGFDAYYGMDEYDGEPAFDGTWAIWDEEFLQYYAREMSRMQEPFCTAVFTASSHHPFRVPQRYEGRFKHGTQPIHQCVGYSDNALRLFFETARTQSWYQNTLFVFTADHTNQLTHAEYTNAKGLFEVPVFFYCPTDSLLTGSDKGVISQTDILPSVLGYLGYDKPYFAFGEDVLTRDKEHPYAVNYNHPVYQVISDSLLVQFDGREVTAVYEFGNDRLLQHNKVDESRNTPEVLEMERYLKAYIQQYIERMIENRLTIETL